MMEGALAELFVLVTPLHVLATVLCLAWPTKLDDPTASKLIELLWYRYVVRFVVPYVFDHFSPFKPRIIQFYLSFSLFFATNFCTGTVSQFDQDWTDWTGEFRLCNLLEMIAVLLYGPAMLILVLVLYYQGGGWGTMGPYPHTPRLVVVGPWHCIRNPMAMLSLFHNLMMLTLAQSIRAFLFLVLEFLIVTAWLKYVEEPELRKRFGWRYQDYFERVPRWIPDTNLDPYPVFLDSAENPNEAY